MNVRKIINWNNNWNFYQGELDEKILLNRTANSKSNNEKKAEDTQSEELSTWDVVQLPHTWNAYDGQDGGNDYYQGVAWYHKMFTVEENWKKVFIRFGAVNKMAEVWCNGNYVGEHRGGFSAFTFELTSFLQAGENEILVKVNNSNELPIYPRQADFTFFGGIYRDVELIGFEKEVHFDVATYGTDALFVTPQVDGSIQVTTYAIGGRMACAKIFDKEGNCIAEAENVLCGTAYSISEKLECKLSIPTPHLWDGTKDSYLYRLQVSLYDENASEEADSIATQFGFRNYKVTAEEGFFLNGVSYPLHGVCRHQDRENLGWAITEKEHLEDMALIREIGANTIRLAHYQQAPFFYDLCDRNGMVVWAEIPLISVYDNEREADENLVQQMQELILQNYNHPSICFWGIANEVGIGGESEHLYEILKELNRITKELDPTRLTVIANVGMTKTDSPLFHITDVASYNEYMGWYEGKKEDHGPFCDERHNQIPNVPLAISEYGAESVISWHSDEPKVKDYTEEYQALVHEAAQRDFEKRPFIWATWLWNMFDFAADARDEGGCKGRNNKGLITYDRSLKKQAFYFYKACWSSEPFVYLCGKRFTKRAKDVVDIKVYSNQKAVILWVNGVRQERLLGNTIFEFKQVPLKGKFNEVIVRTEDGCMDTLIIEKVEFELEEYVLKEEKNVSEDVAQWFASIHAKNKTNELIRELIVNEGYLSVFDPLEEVYRYPEGVTALQELVEKPLSIMNPDATSGMDQIGAFSFANIWHHIQKQLPDDLIYVLNERLNKIKK